MQLLSGIQPRFHDGLAIDEGAVGGIAIADIYTVV